MPITGKRSPVTGMGLVIADGLAENAVPGFSNSVAPRPPSCFSNVRRLNLSPRLPITRFHFLAELYHFLIQQQIQRKPHPEPRNVRGDMRQYTLVLSRRQ